MATKVELLGYGLGGPYEIYLNGTRIDDVEDIRLDFDGKVHRAVITMFVKEYQLRPIKEPEQDKSKWPFHFPTLKAASMLKKKEKNES